MPVKSQLQRSRSKRGDSHHQLPTTPATHRSTATSDSSSDSTMAKNAHQTAR